MDDPDSSLVIMDDLLHHRSLGDFGEELEQLVVPETLREEVMSLAHVQPHWMEEDSHKNIAALLLARIECRCQMFLPGVPGLPERWKAPVVPLPV